MSVVLATILPVFGLIAIGYAAGRSGYLSPAAARGLPEFMFKVAMPALLFRTLGTARLPDVAPLGILATYFGAAGCTWLVATLSTRLLLRRPAADAPSISFGAAFSNGVMMGIPLCLSYFGERSTPVLALIVAFDVATLWTLAALQLAWAERVHGVGSDALQSSARLSRTLADVGMRLLLNPVILACILGLAWQAGGWPLPPLADRIIGLLAQASVPGALCALGLTLATFELKGQMATVALITTLKLLLMPALAWGIATHLLALDPTTAAILTVVAALPVGANAFLFASVHDKAAASVSGAVLVSVVLSLATTAGLLHFIGMPA